MRTLGLTLTVLALAATLSSCGEGIQRGPSTPTRVLNAAPGYDTLVFKREEANATPLDYRTGSTFSFEVGQYDFNVDRSDAAGNAIRLLSFSEVLEPDTLYTFVITDVGGAVEPLIVRTPVFDITSASAEIVVTHAAPAFTAADVYLAAPGADLSAANPLGSVDFRGMVGPLTIDAGEYQFALTEVGNPQNVLFRSPTIVLVAGESNLFAITDGANEGTAPVNIAWLTPAGTLTLGDPSTPAVVRALNEAADHAPRDIIADDNFANPLLGAVPPDTPTDYVEIASGTHDFAVTPAGNPGVIELTAENATLIPGRYYTFFIFGAPGEITMARFVEDKRRIADRARVQIFHGANQFDLLNVYLVPPDTNIDFTIPLTLFGGSQVFTPRAPGEYQLTVRNAAGAATVLGPIDLTLDGGGIYSIVIVDGATAETADVVLFDDFD